MQKQNSTAFYLRRERKEKKKILRKKHDNTFKTVQTVDKETQIQQKVMKQ